MRNRYRSLGMLAAGLLALGIPMFAHHGTAASYDLTKQLTLKGTVTEFRFSNPHCQIYFDVKDAKGNVAHWAAEGASPSTWARSGWNKNTLKAGDQITIILNPSKVEGTPAGVVDKVILASGEEVLRFYDERGRPGGQ